MSEGLKNYIIISGSLLLILLALAICWLFRFSWLNVFFCSYIVGFANGILFLGVSKYE